MTDVTGSNATNERPEPTPRGRRRLATALAGLLSLTVAGGWAYDHRAEYGIAYAQLFDELSSTSLLADASCPLAAADEGPGCCHADGTCLLPEDLAARAPVEAPRPPAALARGDDAAAPPSTAL